MSPDPEGGRHNKQVQLKVLMLIKSVCAIFNIISTPNPISAHWVLYFLTQYQLNLRSAISDGNPDAFYVLYERS